VAEWEREWSRTDRAVAQYRTRGGAIEAYYLCLPPGRRAGAPLLVCVHGISRNAGEHMRHFAPLAQERGVVVVAPLFPQSEFPDYQRLGRAGHGRRADLALHEVLAELGEDAGVTAERIYLFGHSGGGQFVHRYVMANPARVARFVVSAAGWYTSPDPDRPFPFGIAPDPLLSDLDFDPGAFLRVPGTVLVGERDTGRGRSLRTAPLIDATQGRNRVERAREWVKAMNREAARRGLPPPIDLQVLPSAGHRFADVATRGGAPERAFACLFGAGAA
jgi:poly(3-hydroxybutyrate) depolymerase